MGTILVKKDSGLQCYARLKLENDEQVMISVTQAGVKVFKMKWVGMFPAATLWESRSVADVTAKFFDHEKPFQRPLDSMIDKLIGARSAVEVVMRLLD